MVGDDLSLVFLRYIDIPSSKCLAVMRIEDLSVNERILVHLRDFTEDPRTGGISLGQTQEGIGEAVGILINHVPRATNSLLTDGYIDEALVHIGGLKRKRKVFFLTAKGTEIADGLISELKEQKVLFRARDGTETSLALTDILFKTRGNTAARLILTIFREGVILESSIQGESPAVYLSTLHAVPDAELFVDRIDEAAFIKNKLQRPEGLVVVSGIKGIGKTSLVRKVLGEYEGRKNIFWYTLHEWETARSFLEQMAENHVRLGRNELRKMLRQNREADIGMCAQTFLRDVQDSESIIVMDNIFDLKKEVMQLIYMLCEVSSRLRNVNLILITRDRQSLSPVPNLGALGPNDLVLKGLDSVNAGKMLEQLGIDAENCDRVFAMTQGHPLAMKLVNSDEIIGLIDTKGLTKEELWMVRCLKAFDAIFE